jgi:hypothetical protein
MRTFPLRDTTVASIELPACGPSCAKTEDDPTEIAIKNANAAHCKYFMIHSFGAHLKAGQP